MPTSRSQRVCPVEAAGGLDTRFRKWVQNPQKILKPYIHENMTILDVGCGPGFFTLEIAKMLNGTGKVIAADLQQGMLDKVKVKISGTDLEQRIDLHRCEADSLNISQKVDFALAFYVVHEFPNQMTLFNELNFILNPGGKFLIVEPKFHVNKTGFNQMVSSLEKVGFKILEKPKVFFSRSVLVQK
ncbi:MAG: class I SAM-dependent methyltransferase [Bacteroidales bacterium]|nr:class I SAM-dependent methyltransferase [Bacteroidales bacterium]MCF8458005.1 class I SAM-dependent methyltransferase [Bacteroidales bacterium]